jgi:hypothetical protein
MLRRHLRIKPALETYVNRDSPEAVDPGTVDYVLVSARTGL